MQGKLSYLIALMLAISLPLSALAQQSPASTASAIKRTPLQRADVPQSKYEVITGIADIAANASVGRHSHPGIETGYVIEGSLTLLVDGQPPLELKQGDSYKVPESAIHDARTGAAPAKLLAIYIVEKGKPLATPAH